MNAPSLVSAEMREIVGTPYGCKESYPVAASDIRRWVIAVHHPEPPPGHYLTACDLVAPRDFNPFAWGPARVVPSAGAIEPIENEVRVGAMEPHLGLRAPPLRFALNGGLSATYTDARIRPCDVVTAESVVESYRERDGRLGAMLLTTIATTWADQDRELLATHRFTLIRY